MLSIALAWRLARRLHHAWTDDDPHAEADSQWQRLGRAWLRLGEQRERWLQARDRFPAAAERFRESFAGNAKAFARDVGDANASFAPLVSLPPETREFFADIRQLEAEFESLEVNWGDKVLRVTTEAIELRDVELGPFAIELAWENRDSPDSFEIVALEPNPASGGKGITHPHVRDRTLCPGEAAAPLRRALADGRIADAFVLIRSVLRTYNPSSPYAQLAEWGGRPCSECGSAVDDGERYLCEGCDADFCDGCSRGCARCGSSRCSDCLDPCALCHRDLCSGCLDADDAERSLCLDCRVRCSGCSQQTPKDRLLDRLCPACRDIPEEDEPDDDDAAPADETHEAEPGRAA